MEEKAKVILKHYLTLMIEKHPNVYSDIETLIQQPEFNVIINAMVEFGTIEYNRGFNECYQQTNIVGLEVQKRAFDAGRDGEFITDDYFEHTYRDFEDYIKSLSKK